MGIASVREEHLSELPQELWPVGPSIRIADFGSNKLTVVPQSLSAFSALQRLRLSHNQLTDEGIPWAALAGMSHLVVLAMDHNRLALHLRDASLGLSAQQVGCNPALLLLRTSCSSSLPHARSKEDQHLIVHWQTSSQAPCSACSLAICLRTSCCALQLCRSMLMCMFVCLHDECRFFSR